VRSVFRVVPNAIERLPPGRRWLAILGALLGGALVLAVITFVAVAASLPSAEAFAREGLALPTRVYARDGTTLLYEFAEEHREPVTYAELPKALIDATTSAEDRTFWTNPGVDIGGILRAAIRDVAGGGDRP